MTTSTPNSQGNNPMTAAEKPDPEKAKSSKAPPSYPAGAPLAYAAPQVSSAKSAFFTIYKKGQGHWTRLGTVASVALIGLLTGHFVWQERVDLGIKDQTAYLLIGIFTLLYVLIGFYVLNKPSNVDFLIATDSEMKRVNWTSQKDLWGSTRVVIVFMFIMASVLFLYDLFFQTVFWLLGVLKTPPPFFPNKH